MIKGVEDLIKRGLVSDTDATLILLFRYGFVAFTAFVIDFGGLIYLHEVLGMNYIAAATVSFCLGAIVNFFLSTGWIFKGSRVNKLRYEFMIVLAIAGIGLALNDSILWLLTSGLGVFFVYSKLVGTVMVFFWNFFVRKWLLYPKTAQTG